MQIRLRLTIQFILIAAGILAAAFFYVHFQFKLNLQDEFYDSLRSKALIIAEMVVGKKTNESFHLNEPAVENAGPLANEYPENISIYNTEGERLYAFNPAPDAAARSIIAQAVANGEVRFVQGKFHAIAIRYHNQTGDNFIVIAESVFDHVHVQNLTRILFVVFFISISLVAFGGWIFARQALSPVSAIMNQVDALLPTDMSHRLAAISQHDELSRLVLTFNKLLDRIQQVFKNQKMFLSNISHELKNPLNVIVSQVEVSLNKDRTEEEYKHVLQSVLSDVRGLNEVAENLMQMARINADESTIQFQWVRIDELIWQAKSGLLRNHPEYQIQFEIINLPANENLLEVAANEQLLRTALLNLMDNSCKFSENHAVKVQLSFTEQETCQITIADHGPGISDEDMPMIFDPFYRSQRTSATKGSGVGLPLVAAILKMHHIQMKVESNKGEGATFILQFPSHPEMLLPIQPSNHSPV